MNNKKIFSVKLFWQSFKQLKIIGGICTVLLLLLTLLPPVTQAISIQGMLDDGGITSASYGLPAVVSSFGSSAILILTFVIFTPILVLYAWNYLNKRNTSDFYHSLPYTRTCLYVCNLAAVMAWQLVILVVSCLSSVVVYTVLSSFFIVDFGVMFRIYVSIWICNLLCAGGITLACAVTGNVFSNICVSGLILFFPRFIVTLVMMVVGDCVPVLSSSHFVPFLDNSYNMLTGICFSMFGGGSFSDIVMSGISNVYTVLLAVVYLVFAGFLFIKRKSEAAGKGASGKRLQTVIRSVFGFTICIIGVLVAVNTIRTDTSYHLYQIIYAIGLSFLGAAIVMALYEWLSTKNIRNAIRCIPSILVTFGISLVFGLGVNLMADGILNYKPQAEKVDYVTLTKPSNSYMEEDYFQKRVAQIQIEDDRIKEILCAALSDNVDRINEDINMYRYANNYNLIPYEVQFKDGWFGKYRMVYLTEKQIAEIAARLTDVAGYKEAYLDLPAADNVSISWTDDVNFSREEALDLYKTMLQEVREVSFEDWYANVNADSYLVYGYLSFSKEGLVYQMRLPVTGLLPKTMTKYCNMFNRSHAQQDPKLLQQLQKEIAGYADGERIENQDSITLRFYDAATDSYNYLTLREFLNKAKVNGKDTLKKIATAIGDGNFDKPFDSSRAYVRVEYTNYSVDAESEKYGGYSSMNFFVQLEGYDTSDDYYR